MPLVPRALEVLGRPLDPLVGVDVALAGVELMAEVEAPLAASGVVDGLDLRVVEDPCD